MDPNQNTNNTDQLSAQELNRNTSQKLREGLNSAAAQNIAVGSPDLPPKTEPGTKKRILSLVILLTVLAAIITAILMVVNRKPAPVPAPAPTPKPTTLNINIEGPSDLAKLKFGIDYFMETANGHYLLAVTKSPKKIYYDGKEIYAGEDIKSWRISPDGKSWMVETTRREIRSIRDEATKIVQDTEVEVSKFNLSGNGQLEGINARPLTLLNDAKLYWVQKTGRQTPSQYGEALPEEELYLAGEKKFSSAYGILSLGTSPNQQNFYLTANNPNTKEKLDFYINTEQKDPLDARILQNIILDDQKNYMLVFCQTPNPISEFEPSGKDCQVDINGKARTTISGTVYVASGLAQEQAYFGLDRDLKQSFLKNVRSDLPLEHSQDLSQDPATKLKVLINDSGSKNAVISSRIVDEVAADRVTITKKPQYNISINSQLVENTLNTHSFFQFGFGDDQVTLFIYTLPPTMSTAATATPEPAANQNPATNTPTPN